MATSDKSNDKSDRDRLPNAADGDPNYTTDVHTVTEAEADAAERERNEQLRDMPDTEAGPHYNAHLDADGPGGMQVANERTDGREPPTFEERTGMKRDEAGRVYEDRPDSKSK